MARRDLTMNSAAMLFWCAFLALAMFCIGLVARPFVVHNGRRVIRKLKRVLGLQRPSLPIIHPVMTEEDAKRIDSAISIVYVGDLILLRDAVEGAIDKAKRFDFNPMFRHVGKYLKGADWAAGVLEGPVADERRGLSNSVYSDGLRISLNFPIEYLEEIKKAGISFLTTATNHFLDVGVDGAMETLDALDGIGMAHTGTFRNEEEKARIPIVEIRGKRFAVLAYTYGQNYFSQSFFFAKGNAHLTRMIVPPGSRYFKQCMREVGHDFRLAKALHPDAIIVMPHSGTEFAHIPDDAQKKWYRHFVKLGADIVLGDHTHAVQPIEWVRGNGGSCSVIVYCPGNFINTYWKHDGDASMMVDIRLDPNTAKPFAAGIIPLYAFGHPDGHFETIPVNDSLEGSIDFSRLSLAEKRRIAEVHELVTESALGVRLPLHNRQDWYWVVSGKGYVRQRVSQLAASAEDFPNSILLKAICGAKHVCFLGDSITEGTKNGGYGWFEPLATMFPEKKFSRFAKGEQTSVWLRDHVEDIAAIGADLYVVAIGCNDIRYRNHNTCAMTPEAYVVNLGTLMHGMREAHFVFIAPWRSRFFDPYCRMPTLEEKEQLYSRYTEALRELCNDTGSVFVDPTNWLDLEGAHRDALVDHIHPDAHEGIRAFSRACVAYVGDGVRCATMEAE